MTDHEQRQAAIEFADFWKGKGYEKGQSQQFWMSLLTNVLGVSHAEKYISFEDRVVLDHTSFVDGYIEETHVLIEQKSIGKNLKQAIKQSDGTLLSPFQQAKRYSAELSYSKRPRWIVTCNFEEFNVYDMERPLGEPEVIFLKDLPKEYYRLSFLVNSENEHIRKEMEVSLQAGEIVGKLYDALLKQYINPENETSLKSLNMLCVRLVFCLYAEDAGIFGSHGKFHDYLKPFGVKDLRRAMIDLFQVLDTKMEDRDPYLDEMLASFPYVNGGLFAEKNIEIPQFNEEIKELILQNASADFDWSNISPTIFGAVFESTLNPDTRRSGGMHYTSIQNIHKVIDPLFLDALKAEFSTIKAIAVEKTRRSKLESFQEKLAALTFFDPACGSGNFLTETYISLRKLENKLLELKYSDQTMLDMNGAIQVGIGQFYGIEINDFAVTVAKTALWIAESQMMKETEGIVHMNLNFLPLKSYAHIVEGNALRLDWHEVVPKENLNYIMGNPPFVGYSMQSKVQKEDMLATYVDEKGKPYKTAGKIDFVAAWYYKASQLMQQTSIRAAFVSTNSITQGEQVAAVWKPLYERFGIHIDFAYQTFKWESEASDKAAVHCVIVGFSQAKNQNKKRIYLNDAIEKEAENINPYLVDAKNIFIEAKSKPIDDVPILQNGGKPTEGGHLILKSEDKDTLLREEPQAEIFIRPYMMGKDFIQRKPRYCLWMVGANPSLMKKCPQVMDRIKKVKEYRLSSPKEATRRKAETPMLFDEVRECAASYVAIPKVSSESRRYIPMDYLSADIIPGDKLFMLQNATAYHFGILTSNVHMAWMRAVCGRMKSDYSYSNTVVYNNFPWPTPTDKQREKIEQTAQAILDARTLYPDSSLADLYDELTMPPELRKAHQQNDRAVMEAYGFVVKETTESTCVARLMEMYQEKVGG